MKGLSAIILLFAMCIGLNGAHAQGIACTTCHPTQTLVGPHAAAETSCTACHGDGATHVTNPASGGITTFEDEPVEARSAACQTCHSDVHPQGRSAHQRAGVGCNDCHTIHTEPAESSSSSLGHAFDNLGSGSKECVGCHAETFADFRFDERHRLTENALSCTSCHDPHDASRQSRLSGARDQRCATCHPAQDGPFVFEHDASRVEGCTACHEPHGNPNRHLLAHQQTGDLCYSCHAEVPQFHLGFAPGSPVRFGGETVCTNCHVTIHGSNIDRNFLK